MRIETDSGITIESDSREQPYGSDEERLEITDRHGNTINLSVRDYVSLIRSVKLIYPEWEDEL